MRKRTLGLLGASIAMASGLWLACGGSDGAADLVGAPGTDGGGLPETSSTAEGGGGGPDAASAVDAADAERIHDGRSRRR